MIEEDEVVISHIQFKCFKELAKFRDDNKELFNQWKNEKQNVP
jgi:hypothetical protein